MSLKYPYEKRSKYIHLLPSDSQIWTRFINEYPDFFTEIEYDVHVGEGIPTNPEWPDYIADMAKSLTQRRIDVVGYKKESIWIVEIKQDPGVSLIGQILGYIELYKRDYKPQLPLIPCAIVNSYDRDLQFLLNQFGIRYYAV